MQRQSLGGSPASKQNGGPKEDKNQEDEERVEEEEKKIEKAYYHRNEKSIHLIPILTLFCFLLLYLSSHDPSPPDLLPLDGDGLTTLPSKEIDSIEMSDFQRFLGVKKGDVLGIRSHRSLLKHANKGSKYRYPRKIGDFQHR